jgi:hypothetical protein
MLAPEQLARMDSKRKNKTSNKKMKNRRTHLAHMAEHTVDLTSGALVAVTL